MDSTTQEQLLSLAAAGDVAQLQQQLQAQRQEITLDTASQLLKSAVVGSHPSVIDYLLIEFPNLQLNDQIVHAAACKATEAIFTQLLTRDPSIANRRLERLGTTLTSACRIHRPVEFLRYLLEHGADPNKRPETVGYPIALVAARYDDTAAVDLLLEHGARLEHSGALAAAAGSGKETMLRYLLSRGAHPDTDARSVAGDHPLHSALMGNHVGSAEILLDHGASLDALDRNGKDLEQVLDLLEGRGEDRREFKALLLKVKEERSQQ